jgi:chromosomal replication initiator protein
MADNTDSPQELWESVKAALTADERITPQLHGFINLVAPRGVMAGTLYLEVPNELTRGMLEQRIRLPLLSALTTVAGETVSSFAIVVNPEIQHESFDSSADTMEKNPSYIDQSIAVLPVEA